MHTLIENHIVEEVRSPSPKKYDCNLKNIVPIMLSNNFSDFISDMGVTDHIDYDQ